MLGQASFDSVTQVRMMLVFSGNICCKCDKDATRLKVIDDIDFFFCHDCFDKESRGTGRRGTESLNGKVDPRIRYRTFPMPNFNDGKKLSD